jgi:nanoRNase/pAp phosphatase (c-di-AMP/oligoRNAs hydrolase)
MLSLKNPIVAMHTHPDSDTVGSASALIEVFRELGIKARYACADNIPERISFLIADAERAEAPYDGEVIAIDVASPSQLGALFGACDVKFMIDHHEFGEPFAPHYIVGGASSAAEVLLGVIRELCEMGKIKLTAAIAAPLYAAMNADTGRFSYSSATADTYRAAAELIETGIDHARINHLLYSSKDPRQIAAEGIVAAKIELFDGGKIAAATLSRTDRADIPFEFFETAIEIVRSVRGVEIAFIVKETDDGKYKVSLRSTHRDVASVAKLLSGGGHRLAAGCTSYGADINEARDRVLEKIAEAAV